MNNELNMNTVEKARQLGSSEYTYNNLIWMQERMVLGDLQYINKPWLYHIYNLGWVGHLLIREHLSKAMR